MMRLITPIILIGISGALFFMFTDSIYGDISKLNSEIASYDGALNNSKMFENQRDKLTAKSNMISAENMGKLKKLLPDNVDNIRLILEIEQIALPHGMVLRDIKYNATQTQATDEKLAKGTVIRGGQDVTLPKDYGIFDLEFSVSGTYDNFINFTKDLESNLRIVDILSITFSSDAGSKDNSKKISSSEIYKYDFKIKTYWLKN